MGFRTPAGSNLFKKMPCVPEKGSNLSMSASSIGTKPTSMVSAPWTCLVQRPPVSADVVTELGQVAMVVIIR